MPAASIGVDFVANTARWTADIERAKSVLNTNAAQMNASLASVESRMGRVDKSSGAMRGGMQQLSFQINDVAAQMATGTKPMVIFAQQSGQVIQAIQMMSGGSSKFASFMGGPWGIAISVGVSALSALWSMHSIAEKAADKTKKAHETLTGALRTFSTATDSARKALDDYNAAQQQARDNAERNIAINLASAEAKLKDAKATREQLAAELARNESSLSPSNMPVFGGPEDVASYQAGVTGAISAVQAKIAANAAALKTLGQSAIELRIKNAQREAEAAVDPIRKINNRYDDMRDAAIAAAAANDRLSRSLKGTLTAIEQQRKSALDAQKEASKTTNPLALTPAQVGAMLQQQFGGTVTSTTGGKHVKGSYHYAKQAVDYVPQGGMGAVSKDQIRSYLESQGVNLKELFGPGDKGHSDHFHVAFSKTQRSSEEIAKRTAAAADRAEREREQAVRRQAEFAGTLSGLNNDLLNAQRANVTDAGQLADLARQQVVEETKKLTASIDAKVSIGDYKNAQGDQLKAIAAQTQAQQMLTINTELARKYSNDAIDLQLSANDNQMDMLQIQDELALTQADRRKVQFAILAAEEQNLKLELQKAILNSNDVEEKKRLQARLDAVPAVFAAKGKVVEDQTAGPLEAYLKSVNMDAAQMNQALKSVAVDGLQALNDGIFDAITGAKSLGEAFRDVANSIISDLLRIAIQRSITTPLANALFGGGTGGSNGIMMGATTSGGGGILGSLLGLAGSVAGSVNFGGGGAASSLTSSMPGFDSVMSGGWAKSLTTIPGFAVGTPFAPGGLAMVGERGPELVNLPRGSEVIPNHRLGITPRLAFNDNRGARPIQFGDIHVSGGGTEAQNRRTGMQIAASIRQEIARSVKAGY